MRNDELPDTAMCLCVSIRRRNDREEVQHVPVGQVPASGRVESLRTRRRVRVAYLHLSGYERALLLQRYLNPRRDLQPDHQPN